MIKKFRLSDLLLKLKLITEEQLSYAMELRGESQIRSNEEIMLADTLLKGGYISKEKLIPVMEYLLKTPYINLKKQIPDEMAIKLVNEKIARNYKFIPIRSNDEKLQIAITDPMDIMAMDDIKLITGYELQVYWAFWDEVDWAINTAYTSTDFADEVVGQLEEEDGEEVEEAQSADDEEISRAPVVRLINSILEQAVRLRASDIHIEPMEKCVKVRLRMNGDMKEIMTAPKSSQGGIITRIKIMSSLDIAEKRIPQDGRIEVKIMDRPIDFRVSLLPTVFGEKVVMRILDRASIVVSKEQLGFTAHNLKLFDKLIKAPEGVILLSGPTGSGKTTTLYAVLKELNDPTVNIITVEDPVEYRLEGIHQVQVNAKAGLTFAAGLRSILRQDPDIVMVGEIRDAETAQIAVRAAITGHVVLSTIHTNDTASTVSRLTDMGIEVYMVASALVGVIAQRLVKRVCTNCKQPRAATEEEKRILGIEEDYTLYEGTGCNVCNGSGYSGRIAIHEILVMDRELRAMVSRGDTVDAIKDRAKEKGLQTLAESCRELVLNGTTSISEMLRVTYSVDEE